MVRTSYENANFNITNLSIGSQVNWCSFVTKIADKSIYVSVAKFTQSETNSRPLLCINNDAILCR